MTARMKGGGGWAQGSLVSVPSCMCLPKKEKNVSSEQDLTCQAVT